MIASMAVNSGTRFISAAVFSAPNETSPRIHNPGAMADANRPAKSTNGRLSRVNAAEGASRKGGTSTNVPQSICTYSDTQVGNGIFHRLTSTQ